MRENGNELLILCPINAKRPIQALLALALLLQQVTATRTFHGDLTASGTSDTLLCAAV